MTARAGGWAEVLAEAGAAVAPDPVRGIPLDEAGRADLAVPVDRALRVTPPAAVRGCRAGPRRPCGRGGSRRHEGAAVDSA